MKLKNNFPYTPILLALLLGLVPSAAAWACDGPPSYVGFNWAVGSPPGQGPAPLQIKIEGVAYPSPQGDPVDTWEWNFGDQSASFIGPYKDISYTYTIPGTYTINYRARTISPCNIWSTYRTYQIIVSAPVGGVTINPVSSAYYGDTIPLSGTDSTGGTTVHLQVEGPSISPTAIADVPVQSGSWSYSWDTTTLPGGGSYTVMAFDQLYQQWDTASINLMVVITPVYGKIEVTSSPSGATVYLDGMTKGTTPITLTMVNPGSHTVNLELTNYQSYQATVTVTAGQKATLSAILTSIPTTGGLSITSTPSGATILVDGVQKGVTPMGIELLPGSHTVKLQKAGYADYTGTFVVIAGKMAPVTVQLVAVQQTTTTTVQQTTATGVGTLTINSIPANAAIRLDGIAQGSTPKSIQNVKAGSHTVTLSYPGYNNWTGTVTVIAGAIMPITITLIAEGKSPTVSPTTGSLVIRSTPEGANVYLNGEKLGVTPLNLTNVTPGTHRILLTYSGYSDYQENVQVSAGQQATVAAQMVTGQASPGFEGAIAVFALIAILLIWWSRR